MLADLLEDQPYPEQLSLGPIEKEAYGELIEDVLGLGSGQAETLANYLYQRQGGHPLSALASLRELCDRGCLVWKDGEWFEDWERIRKTSLPDSIIPLLLRRLEHVSPEEEQLLCTVSLVGSEIETDLLLAVLPFSGKKAVATLDRMIALQFLEKKVDSGKILFTHDRIREALLSRIDPSERKKIHALLARAIQRQGMMEDPEVVFQLTHHLIEAEEDAGSYVLQAARYAKDRHVHDLAIRYFLIAISQTEKKGAAEKFSIRRELVETYQFRGQNDEALSVLSEMLQESPTKEKQTWILRQFGHCWFKKGNFEKSENFLRTDLLHFGERFPTTEFTLSAGILLEISRFLFSQIPGMRFFLRIFAIRTERNGAKDVFEIYASLARLYYFISIKRAIYTIFRVINIAELRLGHSKELGLALSGFGSLLMAIPLFKWALKYHRNGANMRSAYGDQWGAAQSLQWLGYCLSWSGDYKAAELSLERSYKDLQKMGDPWESNISLFEFGNVSRLSGNYRKALDCYKNGLTSAKKISDDFTFLTGQQSLVVCLIETGDFEKAKSLSEEIINESRVKKQWFVLCALLIYMGCAENESKNYRKATDLFHEARLLAEKSSFPKEYIVCVYAFAAEAEMTFLSESSFSPEERREKLREIRLLTGMALRKTRPWPNNRGAALRAAGSYHALVMKR
ncbi:MAG: hypothetical protein JNM63_02140, partial [Spirochaetia bacterium]|nr:hypothetical protein [Spirochaetia bacterium]